MSRLLDAYRRLFAHGNARLPDAQEEIDYLSGALRTLDGKATALLLFDAILIVAASVLVGSESSLAESVAYWPPAVAASLAFSLPAVLLCLFVVRLAGPFLGRIALTEAVTDFSREIAALSEATERRTRCCQLAWWLSALAVIAILLAFAAPLLGAAGEIAG